jgi:hypothetical protein
MTPDLETLVVAAYVYADDASTARRRYGRRPLISDPELVALAVAQAAMGVPSDRQFLGLIRYRLPGWFGHLPDQTQYNRRLRALTEQLVSVQAKLAALLAAPGVRLVDGTLIGVANYAGCWQRSAFAGDARYGYCRSKSQYVWGVRLVVMSDPAGIPVGCRVVPANEREYEPTAELALEQPRGSVIVADKGLWGAAYARMLDANGYPLRTPDRRRTADNLARERALAGLRLAIESVFSNLKRQMRLEHHLAKTPLGLAQRIAQRLLALTLGILINTRLGRPSRSIAAYDGR